MTIDQASQTILNRLNGLPDQDKQEVFIDPLTIMMIGSIITTAITITKAICEIIKKRQAAKAAQPKTPEENIINNAKSNGIIARLVARRAARKSLGRSNPPLEAVLIQECAKLSPQELHNLLEESNYYA